MVDGPNQVPPERPGTRSSPPTKIEKQGKLEGSHTVTDETGKEPSFADKVPDQKLYEGGSFLHEAKLAWNQSGWTLFTLILSKIFPFVSPPSLGKPNYGAGIELTMLQAQNKTHEDPEVQKILRAIVPDTSKLAAEWDSVKNKGPEAVGKFVAKVERQYQQIENIDLGEVPYLEEAKETELLRLKPIIQEAGQKTLGNSATEWRKKLEAFKQFPIEQDPLPFFTFCRALEGKIEELKQQETSSALKDIKNNQIRQMQDVLDQSKQEIAQRVQTLKEGIDARMPKKELKEIAKKLGVQLPEASFGKQIEFLQKNFVERKGEASKIFSQEYEKEQRLEREMADLSSKKTQREGDRAKDIKQRQEKEDWIPKIPQIRKELTKRIEENELQVAQLAPDEKDLLAIQRGEKKEGLFNTSVVPFTPQRKAQLERTQESLSHLRIELQKDRQALKELPSYSPEQEATAIRQLSQEFVKKSEQAEKDISEYSRLIAQKQSERTTTAEKRQKASLETSRLNALEREFKTGVLGSLNGADVKKDAEQFVRLSYVQGAFNLLQSSSSESRAALDAYYQAEVHDTDHFKTSVTEELRSLFTDNSEAYRAAVNSVGLVAVRSNLKLPEELQEFRQ